MPLRIVDSKDVRTKKATATGAYYGPGGDSRYYKAGADIPATYVFDHEVDTRGFRPNPNPPVVVAKAAK
jgi:hypothetical protein